MTRKLCFHFQNQGEPLSFKTAQNFERAPKILGLKILEVPSIKVKVLLVRFLPLAEVIMCSGFFFICALEELLHHFLHPPQVIIFLETKTFVEDKSQIDSLESFSLWCLFGSMGQLRIYTEDLSRPPQN